MSYTAIRPQQVPVYPGDPATHFPPSKAAGEDKDPGWMPGSGNGSNEPRVVTFRPRRRER